MSGDDICRWVGGAAIALALLDESWQLATMILGNRKIEDVFIIDANYAVPMQELCESFSTRDNQ